MQHSTIDSGFGQMSIVNFEQRVKMYATRANMGYVNLHQLSAAFQGTQMFSNIHDTSSKEYKFLTSPFVADFPIGSNLEVVVA